MYCWLLQQIYLCCLTDFVLQGHKYNKLSRSTLEFMKCIFFSDMQLIFLIQNSKLDI